MLLTKLVLSTVSPALTAIVHTSRSASEATEGVLFTAGRTTSWMSSKADPARKLIVQTSRGAPRATELALYRVSQAMRLLLALGRKKLPSKLHLCRPILGATD